jgi:hypothetical protein
MVGAKKVIAAALHNALTAMPPSLEDVGEKHFRRNAL